MNNNVPSLKNKEIWRILTPAEKRERTNQLARISYQKRKLNPQKWSRKQHSNKTGYANLKARQINSNNHNNIHLTNATSSTSTDATTINTLNNNTNTIPNTIHTSDDDTTTSIHSSLSEPQIEAPIIVDNSEISYDDINMMNIEQPDLDPIIASRIIHFDKLLTLDDMPSSRNFLLLLQMLLTWLKMENHYQKQN